MSDVLRISWSEWNELTHQVVLGLKLLVKPETRTLCLQAPDLIQGLLGVCAASQLGLQLLLDEKSQITGPTNDILLAPAVLADGLQAYRALHLYPDQSAMPPLDLDQLRVTFMTSGSTGQPKHIQKTGAGLKAEVQVLLKLYGLQNTDSILSFVRPFHIYGFLHALLLPIQARAKLSLWPSHLHVPTEAFQSADLLIAVPSQWSLIDSLLDVGEIKRLISSGAAFGLERTRLLQQHPRKPREAYEILGSTETGGIGYRSLLTDSSCFELLEGVHIESSDLDGTWIVSPFLAPESRAYTADQLELLSDRSFRHCGRADRVFKYAGKRFSLSEIEVALSQICEGATVVCHFTTDNTRAQGGFLQAWIEWERMDLAEVRAKFLAKHALPFPQIVVPMMPLPRDEQGKVQLSQLIKD